MLKMKINPNDINTLDLETAPNEGAPLNNTYALEPWRYRTNQARITSCAVAYPDCIKQIHEKNNSILELKVLLKSLKGKQVYAHNALFDIGWLIEYVGFDLVKDIKWRDSQLLFKWILNSQATDKVFSMALDNLVKKYVKEHPDLEEFLDIKKKEVTAGEDYEYWLKRGKMDADLTRVLVLIGLELMPESMHTQFILEQSNLVFVSRSQLNGLDIHMGSMTKLQSKIPELTVKLAKEIGITVATATSPKQCVNYVENVLGLKLPLKTPKGAPSASKDSLMLLHFSLSQLRDKRRHSIKHLLDIKSLNTTKTKFVDGAIRCNEYLGMPKSMSSPRIFGTYTGRFTYSNKIMKKFQIGLATHQLPRKGPIRGAIRPPPGYKVGELDAAAQEMRFMAHFSQDETMVDNFNNGINAHSSMGSTIGHMEYDEFQAKFKAQDKEVTNFRYAGKLLNLSCQYRISGKALASKFFSNYQIVISEQQGRVYESLYRQHYPGVPKYWDNIIRKGRENEYAESIGGRRFGIDRWRGRKWQSESSAINHPIQGSGADHKNIVISYVSMKYPEMLFALDLHDGLWFFYPEEWTDEDFIAVRDDVNTINFHDIWNCEHVVDFPFDAQVGTSFGNVKEIG